MSMCIRTYVYMNVHVCVWEYVYVGVCAVRTCDCVFILSYVIL